MKKRIFITLAALLTIIVLFFIVSAVRTTGALFPILLGSLTIGLALLLPNLDLTWPWGLLTWITVLGFAAVIVLTFWLLWSIWRSGFTLNDGVFS